MQFFFKRTILKISRHTLSQYNSFWNWNPKASKTQLWNNQKKTNFTKRRTLSLFKSNAAFPFLGFGTLTGGTDPSAPFSASSSTASSSSVSAAKAAETTWKGSDLASFNKLKLTHLLGFLSLGLKTSGQREKVVKRGLGLKETSEAVRSCGNTEEEEAYVSISDEGRVVVAIVMERELRLSLEMKLWLNCYLSIYIRDKRGFTV